MLKHIRVLENEKDGTKNGIVTHGYFWYPQQLKEHLQAQHDLFDFGIETVNIQEDINGKFVHFKNYTHLPRKVVASTQNGKEVD